MDRRYELRKERRDKKGKRYNAPLRGSNGSYLPKEPWHKHCEQCGLLFKRKRSGQRYCSRECGFASYAAKPKALKPYPACVTCGTVCSRRRARFCSDACRSQRKCRACGALIGKGKQYCSACRPTYKPVTPTERICPICKTTFLAVGQVYVCWNQRCRVQYHRARKQAEKLRDPRNQTNWQLVQAVFQRDRWRCHLCRKRVDPSLRYPHTMSASVDHVVPVSQGGTNDPHNLRLAHLTCNVAKCAKPMGEQLMLFG